MGSKVVDQCIRTVGELSLRPYLSIRVDRVVVAIGAFCFPCVMPRTGDADSLQAVSTFLAQKSAAHVIAIDVDIACRRARSSTIALKGLVDVYRLSQSIGAYFEGAGEFVVPEPELTRLQDHLVS